MDAFRENIGKVLGVLFLAFIFAALGVLLVPSLAPLMIFLLWLDVMFGLVALGAFVVVKIRERFL